jgi:hypothetical protein
LLLAAAKIDAWLSMLAKPNMLFALGCYG